MAVAHFENTDRFSHHGVVRVGGDAWRFGLPNYLFHTTLVVDRTDETTAVLKGLVYRGTFSLEHGNAIRRVLIEQGFTHYGRWWHQEGREPRFIRLKL